MSVDLRAVAWAPNYFAGSDGQIYSRRRNGEILPLSPSRTGKYLHGCFYVRGEVAAVDWHSVIAEAFHGSCPIGQEVRHRDGDSRNNLPTNLHYGTRKQNAHDRREHGTSPDGERHPMARLTWADVEAIRADPKTRGSGRALAARFGVTPSRITLIRQGKNWKRQTEQENRT